MTPQACTCIWTVRYFTSLQNRASNFGQYTDITLQGVLPISNHKIQFFVGNQEIKLQSKDNRDWVPVQRQYALRFPTVYVPSLKPSVCRGVSPTSKIHVGIQMKSGPLPWAKKKRTSKLIDLQKLFDGYWTSNEHRLTIPGRS